MLVSPALSAAQVAAHQQNNMVSSPPVIISLKGTGLCSHGTPEVALSARESSGSGSAGSAASSTDRTAPREPSLPPPPSSSSPPPELLPLLPAAERYPVYIVERAGRGRCVHAAALLPVGAVVEALSSLPYAACPLRANEDGICAHCLRLLAPADAAQHVACACPRGCAATYCSEACREADFAAHGHEAALRRDPHSAVGKHAALSADLSADADPDALDRFGLMLLAARCLWRRHRVSPDAPGDVARRSRTAAGAGRRLLLRREEEGEGLGGASAVGAAEDELFDALQAEGTTGAEDEELGAFAEGAPGFLPPGATAPLLTRMIARLRAHFAAIYPSDEVAAESELAKPPIACGVYPRQAILNHSCEPNCALRFAAGGRLLLSVVRDVAPDEELCIAYVDATDDIEARQARLMEQYSFVCTCAKCQRESRVVAVQ
jgi:hypothetical protein